jgi:asparagine synthase (glutamine-hydrolysing)
MPRDWAEPQLKRMVETLRHGPNYEVGTWIEESMGVYVGWAALKNSFASGMPLRSATGNVTLVFSGEDYAASNMLERASQNGHTPANAAPAYLVDKYQNDPAFPAGLNGRFQGLVADKSRGIATLLNDRYGLHRIYFHESRDAFYFAAEAKAILSVHPELRAIDAQSFGEFVACGCVLENRSLFSGIQLVPPASAWTFRNGAIEKKSAYFDPREWESQPTLEPEAYYQSLRETFSRAVPRYFGGREPIGMSLTGGLDTRIIMAWTKCLPGSLPCYSFGGMFRDCEDVTLARQVARACEQPFELIPVGDEFLSKFARYAEQTVYRTDGCASVKNSADLYVNERAFQIAPVRMTGNYGGEILRQVRAFKPVMPAASLFRPDFYASVEAARGTYNRLLAGNAVSFIAFRQVPWHHYGLLALEQSQISMRSPYLDNDIVRLAYRAQGAATAESDVFKDSDESVRLIADGNPQLARIRTDRGLAGSAGSLSNSVTRAYLEFTFKSEYAYDYGMPQWLAGIDHRLSALRLERLFLGRHKFNHYRVWYRDALSSYVREMLLDSRTLSRPYVNRAGVESIVNGHLKGDHNYTTEIHQLLTLELIHRLFIDSN